ncbi:hypothetical protein [Herbaspirillum sp.]|uniref:hypothetical protein n=1 Tax=Herbaspirillum sp. TaxID=1890675 RepID=UPI000C0B6A63|nr:hypothetical protein [Herbaspirillum sp.]MAF04390.1 hypothetical protein [Herbaspirillum sp.]|tara:strand:+ start:6448 stop:6882 length:435 start_codon:yes stop_codon:yes gene_type:complete
MTALLINSQESFQRAMGVLREEFGRHHYLKINLKTGKDRSLGQNATIHCWYEQLARELREEDALGWKCFCKLHFGVPILRAEDEEYREVYDCSIKGMTYERKLIAMKQWPVTSLMTTTQLSKFAEAMQAHFRPLGVNLEFLERK